MELQLCYDEYREDPEVPQSSLSLAILVQRDSISTVVSTLPLSPSLSVCVFLSCFSLSLCLSLSLPSVSVDMDYRCGYRYIDTDM